ncbi:9541_t:CDS:10 [Gigaspora rosea]|nr:9541_t:CDS:10 [Gigaspora rosea]
MRERLAVYQIPTENDVQDKSVPFAIQKIFYQMQMSDTTVGTKELIKSFGWNSLNSFMQHDAHEFYNLLRNNLESKMKNTNDISKLFVGKIKSYIKCIDIDYESSRVEDYYDIQLNVKGCKTLDDSFMDYIKEETLNGDNKYYAGINGLQDATKRVIFESFPPVLHLQLKRFEYDAQIATVDKINDSHEFPMEIDLEKYLSPEADRSKPHKYLLYGVLVHSGYYYGGHYSALIKPTKNGKWLKFNDDRVVPVTDKEVLERCYGGGIEFSSAYVLVYIRESDIDDVLSPMLPEDIPEHLQRSLDKQKIKEEEEQRSYLCAKDVINILLPKDSIIDDVLREILLNLSLPGLTNRVRLFEVTNYKNLKEHKSNDPINKIQEAAILYAEEITQDEAERDVNDKVIQVYHFSKSPSCTHGIPFKFVIKAGEIFSATKLRLQARLGMNEEDFSEVKIAIVQEKPCIESKYIFYSNAILSDHNWTSDKYLGLDYVRKTEQVGMVGDDRKAVYVEE